MNQQAMLRKVRAMQQEMLKTQEEISLSDFTGSAGGVVTVTVKGTKELDKIVISENFEIESKDDLDMLAEMIVAACSVCYEQIEKTTEEKLSKYQAFFGGMGNLF